MSANTIPLKRADGWPADLDRLAMLDMRGQLAPRPCSPVQPPVTIPKPSPMQPAARVERPKPERSDLEKQVMLLGAALKRSTTAARRSKRKKDNRELKIRRRDATIARMRTQITELRAALKAAKRTIQVRVVTRYKIRPKCSNRCRGTATARGLCSRCYMKQYRKKEKEKEA